MEEQTPVYIGAEGMIRYKANIALAELLEVLNLHNASLQEKLRIRDAFVACLEAVEIKEGLNENK